MIDGAELWTRVADKLRAQANEQDTLPANSARLNNGQTAALRAIAARIVDNGLVIADEVGMGKTRIAVEVIKAVTECGGRAAILIPPGLGYQWQDELQDGGLATEPLLRSLQQYVFAWGDNNKPWFDSSVVLVSHAFTNWRLSGNSFVWRWGLVPELYAQLRKLERSRVPNGYNDWPSNLNSDAAKYRLVQTAAKSISQALTDGKIHSASSKIEKLTAVDWSRLQKADEYLRQGNLRELLENTVGLGLGTFDLVVIDEAHKSRGDDSGLSNLIRNVINCAPAARRLALTATPVELELSQWEQTLKRIALNDAQLAGIKAAIEGYDKAVQAIRLSWRDDEQARTTYEQAADAFQRALNPFLLRRDKREDPTVQRFRNFGLPLDEYRKETSVEVNHQDLSKEWKQAICAAEALSVLANSGSAEERSLQRLRLTIGNGHGIAAIIHADEPEIEDPDADSDVDADSDSDDGATERAARPALAAPMPHEEQTAIQAKRETRIDFWRTVIKDSFAGIDNPLYDHPAILAAVTEIERETNRGEKVLVFGRYIRPLTALADLLNAREMIRRLMAEEGEWWPESDIKNISAAQAACRQMGLAVTIDELKRMLETQFNRRRYQMDQFRERLPENLRAAMSSEPSDDEATVAFQALERRLANSTEDGASAISLIARPLIELLDENYTTTDPVEYARAFRQMVAALAERGEADENQDGEISVKEADRFWSMIQGRLAEQYNTQRGTFARLLIGGMKPGTKRMLQLAFNRAKASPRVLIAQSLVGREGLNLHKACRIVVLLHPEWNPGVVEQQIGRVDRVGSLWCKRIEELGEGPFAPDAVPRIEVRPVIFKSTYDEYNWKILRKRWDSLRAQLHGIVIQGNYSSNEDRLRVLAQRLTDAAPNFSPTNKPEYCLKRDT